MKRTSQRAAVHLDADAFFVGCEVAAEPRLRGKAVAVGGMKRGIIASASYEARRLGDGVIAQARGATAVDRIAVIISKTRLLERFLQIFDQLPFLVCPSWNLRQTALVVVDEVVHGKVIVVDDAVD